MYYSPTTKCSHEVLKHHTTQEIDYSTRQPLFQFHWRLIPPYNLLADSPFRIVQLTETEVRGKMEKPWNEVSLSLHPQNNLNIQSKKKQTNKQKNTHPTTLFSGPHCSLHILLLLVLVKPYWQSLLLKHFSVSCFLEQMCCNKVATDDNRLWEISILHYPVTHLLP